ncbi:hypothetical protein [Asticcacaulis sp.]|uniref:hypothetical protein n=1 Tax=Asticcacaulis sp. TaxID=1872648 RepID=UPI0026334B62|nr:hypothetical protein [Asticcacaulis sp.]
MEEAAAEKFVLELFQQLVCEAPTKDEIAGYASEWSERLKAGKNQSHKQDNSLFFVTAWGVACRINVTAAGKSIVLAEVVHDQDGNKSTIYWFKNTKFTSLYDKNQPLAPAMSVFGCMFNQYMSKLAPEVKHEVYRHCIEVLKVKHEKFNFPMTGFIRDDEAEAASNDMALLLS